MRKYGFKKACSTQYYYCDDCAKVAPVNEKQAPFPNSRIVLCVRCSTWTFNYIKKSEQESLRERIKKGEYAYDLWVLQVIQELFKNEDPKPVFNNCSHCGHLSAFPEKFATCIDSERIFCTSCYRGCDACLKPVGLSYLKKCCSGYYCLKDFGEHRMQYHQKPQNPLLGWTVQQTTPAGAGMWPPGYIFTNNG